MLMIKAEGGVGRGWSGEDGMCPVCHVDLNGAEIFRFWIYMGVHMAHNRIPGSTGFSLTPTFCFANLLFEI